MVLDPKQLDDISRRISEILPPGFGDVKRDFEKNLHSILQSAFARLDLVTREEFEVQSAVLLRTREKVEALEAQLAVLEKQLGDNLPGKESPGQ
ncbi:ubiquinone biosynthesis accessory factor UbiK [Kaarinaea lacus]